MGFAEKDLLLLVWVHGFKGNDVTFESFPERVSHLLRATHPTLRVESRVFPAYQTRGELTAATLAFVDWLTTLTVELEVDHGAGGGAGKAKVVLMGHSMGGLLIADAALDIAKNTRDGDPMWPRIVAIVAYDTPYLGLHPGVFKHGISQAASYYETARNVASTLSVLSPIAVGLGFGKFGGSTSEANNTNSPASNSRSSTPKQSSTSTKGKERAVTSSSFSSAPSDTITPGNKGSSWWNTIPAPSSKSLYGLGAVALGAAAVGTAYYRREDFLSGWKWGYEHMTFVRNLWDEEGMKGRLEDLSKLVKERNIQFWNFYTHLPATPPNYLVSRTFTIIPPANNPTYSNWQPSSNHLNTDEIHAHMGMFNPKTNDGFYDLGLTVVRVIGERIEEEGVQVSVPRRGSAVAGLGEKGGRVDDMDVEMGDDGVRVREDGDENEDEDVDEDKWRMEQMKKNWKEEKDEKGRTIWVEI